MRKAKLANVVIVREKDYYTIQNLDFVNSQGYRFECIHYNVETQHLAYHYKTLQDIIKTVLSILEERGYKMDYYEAFGAKWYPIWFYNLSDSDAHFEHYGYTLDREGR